MPTVAVFSQRCTNVLGKFGFTVSTIACVAATKSKFTGSVGGHLDFQHVLYGTLNLYSHFHVISIFRFCTSI